MDMNKLSEHSSDRKSYYSTPSAASKPTPSKSSGGFMNMNKLARK
jgi:hypothetical protein